MSAATTTPPDCSIAARVTHRNVGVGRVGVEPGADADAGAGDAGADAGDAGDAASAVDSEPWDSFAVSTGQHRCGSAPMDQPWTNIC